MEVGLCRGTYGPISAWAFSMASVGTVRSGLLDFVTTGRLFHRAEQVTMEEIAVIAAVQMIASSRVAFWVITVQIPMQLTLAAIQTKPHLLVPVQPIFLKCGS